MKTPATKVIYISMLWVTLALASALFLWFRLALNFDLSTFFPNKTGLAQDVLLEQLKNGPGSRLIVIGINGAAREQLAVVSGQMQTELASNPLFVNVFNGEYSVSAGNIPEPVNSYYLLLGNIDYSPAALRQALQSRLKDLAFGSGATLLDLTARDPYLQTLEVLERLAPVNKEGEQWYATDGSAVLLVETRAEAVDIAAQERAISAVRQVFAKIPGANFLELEMTGVGAFGVEMQKVIQAEATKRTLLASSALLLVLLIVYHKLRFLVLATLPVGMGFLVGLAVVTLVFENVHGITLAFGFTLMGVAVDYPLHIFSHARKEPADVAIQKIWPTLRLGALSTAIAYAAIALSGSSGLAQLGVFTACGVMISLWVTRTWLPLLMGNQDAPETVSVSEPQSATLIFLPAILILGFAVLSTCYLLEDHLWDDSLSSLSPVPEKQLARDALLRSAATTPDMRYQLVLHGPTLESLLETSETVEPLLQDAVDDGLLVSWQSISQVLPSLARQKLRRAAIPESEALHANLIEALAETPFSPEAFQPFEANARSTKSLALLTPGHFKDTPLASWLDSHLIKLGDHWVSLISLSKPKPAELAERIKSWNAEIELVNLQQSSLDLVRDYRLSAIKTIFVAVLVIIALLLFQDRNPRTVAWIALTVASSVAVTIAVVTSFHAGLTIIHLVALLLVIGQGMDYALFFSSAESDADRRATRHAVLACAVTTALTFGILAGSSLPVLNFMGLTVATGTVASFILAFVGSKQFSKKRD